MKGSTPVPYTPTPWEMQTMGQDVWIDTPVDHNGGIRRDIGRLAFRGDDPVTKSNASLIVASANSYGKHCGPNAIQCAEDDLLGLALDALRSMVGLYAPNALRGGDWMYSGNSRTDAVTRQVRDVFARIPK